MTEIILHIVQHDKPRMKFGLFLVTLLTIGLVCYLLPQILRTIQVMFRGYPPADHDEVDNKTDDLKN